MGLLLLETGKLPGEWAVCSRAWCQPEAPVSPRSLPRAEPSLLLCPTGILFSLTIVGPGVAFMLGSAMLRFYVDIDKVSSGEAPQLWEKRGFHLQGGSLCQWGRVGIQHIPVPAVSIQRSSLDALGAAMRWGRDHGM